MQVGKVYSLLGKNGAITEDISAPAGDARNNLPVGTLLKRIANYDEHTYVITGSIPRETNMFDAQYGKRYQAVNLETKIFTFFDAYSLCHQGDGSIGIRMEIQTHGVMCPEVAAVYREAAEENERKRLENIGKERAIQDAIEARGKEILSLWEQSATPFPVAVTIARLVENTSDTQSDYWGHRDLREIILSASKTDRNNSKEMRKAAELLPQTMHLATGPDTFEHRENYSMGHGMYLKADYIHYDGWYVKKYPMKYFERALQVALGKGEFLAGLLPKKIVDNVRGLFGDEENLFTETYRHTSEPTLDTSPEFDQQEQNTTGPTMRINAGKNGVEISFPTKPSAEIRALLKSSGFRWSTANGIWYQKQSPQAISSARVIIEATNNGK